MWRPSGPSRPSPDPGIGSAASLVRSQLGVTMRVLIAGILGGIAMYVWASVAHLSPLGAIGAHTMPNERLVVAALQLSLGDKGGVYVYPGPSGGGAAAKPPAPTAEGMLAYTPNGAGALTPRQLGTEFALEMIEALL